MQNLRQYVGRSCHSVDPQKKKCGDRILHILALFKAISWCIQQTIYYLGTSYLANHGERCYTGWHVCPWSARKRQLARSPDDMSVILRKARSGQILLHDNVLGVKLTLKTVEQSTGDCSSRQKGEHSRTD